MPVAAGVAPGGEFGPDLVEEFGQAGVASRLDGREGRGRSFARALRKFLLTALLVTAAFAVFVNVWYRTGYTPFGTAGFAEAAFAFFGYARFVAIPVAVFAFLYQRGQPTKTLAWVALMLGLPFAGTVVYLFFGLNMRHDLRFRRKQRRDAEAMSHYESTVNDTSGADLFAALTRSRGSEALARQRELVCRTTGAEPSSVHDYCVYHDGAALFEQLVEDIDAARHHVHVEYFLYEDDYLGERVAAAMRRAAKRGVEVRVIYDAVGSRSTSRRFWRKLAQAGVEVTPFFAVHFRHLASRINYRNHRKIVVVDGETGYTGGMNVAKQYIEGLEGVEAVPEGHWRDTHVRLRGHAVSHLQLIFAFDWRFSNDIELTGAPYFRTDFAEAACVPVQIASSGPDTPRNNIKYAYFNILTRAERYCYLVTPYFAPDNSMLSAMKTAALSGIDVRLLLPRRSDSLLVTLASNSFVAELLEAGVGVYHYTAGMLHSKVIVSDDVVVSIGTANMDARSHDLNFEVNAMLYDVALAERERAVLEADMRERCTRLTTDNWPSPRLHIRLARGFARVFSPLL